MLTSNTASNTISPQSDIELTVMQGANSGLTEDIVVLNGSVQVGSGAQIITKGKTLEQIAKAITAQGNVKASIQDGKFTVKSENGEVNIKATGDFARITGIGNYTVQRATTSNTSAQNVYVSQGAATGLTGSETVVSGTIKIGSGAEINTTGKTLNQIINEIDLQGNVTASITDGKFTIESETSGVSIQATGDMARVTGLASYTTQSGTTTNVASENPNFVKPVIRLTESEALAQGYTVIKTAADLDNIRNNLDGKYILMGDIDMSFFTGWTPIGSESDPFTGTLDGNGYVLKNFIMNDSVSDYSGLFGRTAGATIKNLGIENISGEIDSEVAGALVGATSHNTQISNCYVTGEMTINGYDAGGLVGELDNSAITDCSTDLKITVENKSYTIATAGGLVGSSVNSSIITNCSSAGSISAINGELAIGGLVGCNESSTIHQSVSLSSMDILGSGCISGGLVGKDFYGTISNCGATGDVIADLSSLGIAGGLVGYAYDTNISKSYATGEVTAQNCNVGGLIGETNGSTEISDSFATGAVDGRFAGGLIGHIGGDETILRCYAAGSLAAHEGAGGLVGYINISDTSGVLTIEYSFWDKQKTGQSRAIYNYVPILTCVNGLNTADFANEMNFINAGWDEDVWDFSGSTPTLKNMFSKDGAASSSTLTGSVNTNGMTDTAFDGQSTGQLSFSNGVNVNISATDTRSEVLEKINDAGLSATIGTDGKIKITAQGVSDLSVTSDTSGFSDFYGLSSTGKTYTGTILNSTSEIQPATSTTTGSINTNDYSDNYFYGQTDGQISFSNGINVNISATDTRSEVLEKINDAGLNASIGTDGKIKITAEGVSDLTITSDTSGFSNFYGLDNTEDNQTGNITITTETVPDPDGGSTGGDGGDGSGTGGTDPDNPDGGGTGGTDTGKTPPVGALRLQIGADSTESSAIYVDTEFDLGEFEVDFTSADSCAAAIEDIDEVLSEINRKRAEFGAVINRINTILTTQTITIQNYSASKSTIMDADIATESAEYVKNQILQQTSSTLLAQSENLHSSIIMSLIS